MGRGDWSTGLKDVRESAMHMSRRTVLQARGGSQGKSPDLEACLQCGRNMEEARVVGKSV